MHVYDSSILSCSCINCGSSTQFCIFSAENICTQCGNRQRLVPQTTNNYGQPPAAFNYAPSYGQQSANPVIGAQVRFELFPCKVLRSVFSVVNPFISRIDCPND